MNDPHNAGFTTKRFDIPISHLDYDYIEKCTSVKELEKIFVVLKSGDEGIYPDLEKTCEEKIRNLNPNSRVLRKETPLLRPGDVPEWKDIDQDLKSWSEEMKQRDQTSVQSAKVIKDQEFEDESLPPVRSGAISVNGTDSQEDNQKTTGNKRVMPRDYREWDKIDVDKELEKIDKNEDKKSAKSAVTKAPEIEDTVDTTDMSEDEKLLKATREKEKGNEAFRAGDHAEAILYYSRSISLQPIAASYNNRALAYLKSSNWNKALTDCNKVLEMEPDNIKALLRRGSAYKGKKDFTKAKTDFEKVLELESGNKRAEELLQELDKAVKEAEEEKRKKKEKGRRMVIEEVEGDEEEDEVKVDDSKVEEKQTSPKSPTEKQKEFTNKKGKKNKSKMKNNTEEAKLTNGLASEIMANAQTENERLKPAVKNENCEVMEEKEESNAHVVQQKLEPLSENADSSDKDLERTSSKVISDSDKQSSEETNTDERKNDEPIQEIKRPVFVQVPLPPDVAKLREQGNNLFRQGQYSEAIQKYSLAISKLEKGSDGKEQVVNLSLIYNNRSACNLKIGSSRKAIEDATQALQLIPHSIKPLLRRAAAYEDLERYGHAYIDYKHILKIDPSVELAHQGSTRCQGVLRDQHGLTWRDKIPEAVTFSSSDIPEIVDTVGQTIHSKVTPVLPGNTPVIKETVVREEQAATSIPQDSAKTDNIDVTSKPREVTPTTMPPLAELTTEEKFDQAKSEGNKHVQEGRFHQAIDCYNKCAELLPDRAVSFTNRALCYLRLNQPSRTEEDCNTALSLEADNIKALFRRAQARKMMKHYKDSLEDLTHLLKVDSKNTAAKKEMELVKGYYREELQKLKSQMPNQKPESSIPASVKGGNKQRKRMVIQETSDDETETPKTGNTQKMESKADTKPTTTASQKTQEKAAKSAVKQEKKASSKKTSIKQTSTGLPVVPPSAPKLGKATPYEFIQAWNSLKTAENVEPYADLLRQITPDDLPNVISNKLDGPMLSKITKCIAEKFVAQGDADMGYSMLSNLCKVSRFGTITMFLSRTEKQDVQNVFSKLAETKSELYTMEDLSRLRKAYSIS